MTLWNLAVRSVRHYRWLNLGVLAGVALTAAIISGSLAVGDSVRASLRANAATRRKDGYELQRGLKGAHRPIARSCDVRSQHGRIRSREGWR